MIFLEIICDILNLDAVADNQDIIDNTCLNETKPMATSPTGEDAGNKPQVSDPDICKKLTEKVIEAHKNQSYLHPVTTLTETDEHGRTHTAIAGGATLPVLGDKTVTGCVSYPSAKDKK